MNKIKEIIKELIRLLNDFFEHYIESDFNNKED